MRDARRRAHLLGSYRTAALALALALVLQAIVARPLHAQPEANHLYDKYEIDFSGADVLIGPKVKVDSDNSDGTEIDTGDVLGISRNGFEPRLAFRWRPGHRHEIEVGYLFLNRSGEKQLTRDITVKDTTFTAGLTLNSTFAADNAFLSYRYAFTAKEKTQIGAELGLGAIFFDLGIDALAGVSSGNASLSASYGASGGFTVPTLALGLYGRFRLGERWYLEADAGAIGGSIDNITVTLFQGGLAGRYFLSKRIGFEAGYGITTVKLTVDQEGSGGLFDPAFDGSIKYPFQNLRLGVIAAFQ